MKQLLYVCKLFLLMAGLGALLSCSTKVWALEATAGELSSGYDWASHFTTDVGLTPSVYFGAYVFHEFNGELYIGVGRGRPADTDGASLVKFDGTTVTSLGELDEQGVNEITSVSDRVVISGVDPTNGDDWSLGNIYTTTGSSITKYRTGNGLANVIHTWGLHADGDVLYAAVSSHDGTNPEPCIYGVECFGEVYKSLDKGATWTKLATLGEYRVFDITKFNGKLYANYVNEVTGDSKLAYSTDGGTNWTDITLPAADGRRTHFVEFNNQLIMLGGGTSGNKLYVISTDNVVTQYDLSFGVGHLYGDATHFSNYNQFVVVGNYLYALDRTGGIRRTTDLTNWEVLVDTSYTLISLGYWPSQNKLVFSDTGTTAKVYMLDLDEVAVSVTNVPPTIEVIDVATGLNVETPSAQFQGTDRTLRLTNASGLAFAEVVTDLTTDRSWSAITGDATVGGGRAFSHGVADAAGTAATYTLLVPMLPNSLGHSVVICPHATTFDGITQSCLDAVRARENQTVMVNGASVTVAKTTIGGAAYWRVAGLTGTGAMDTSGQIQPSTHGGGTPKPQLQAKGGGTIEQEDVIFIAQPETYDYDVDLSVAEQSYDRPFNVGSYWQLSPIYQIWPVSFFNGARVVDQSKPSIVALRYDDNQLTVDGSWHASEKSLKLAVSTDDGKHWKVLSKSVVDPVNNTVAVVGVVGGWYAVVGR